MTASAVFDDGNGRELYVGGTFDAAGDVAGHERDIQPHERGRNPLGTVTARSIAGEPRIAIDT